MHIRALSNRPIGDAGGLFRASPLCAVQPTVRLGVEVVGLLRFGGNGKPGYGNTHNGPT